MKNGRNDLGVIALIAGAGAVGVLATMFVLASARGPAAAPEQIDARQQEVAEVTKRISEAARRLSEMTERIEVQEIAVSGTASADRKRVVVRVRSSEALEQSNPPVIYIDGVRVDGTMGEVRELLDPDQIDRIEVIKGDAAREQFGSEARHGVVQIYTKPNGGS